MGRRKKAGYLLAILFFGWAAISFPIQGLEWFTLPIGGAKAIFRAYIAEENFLGPRVSSNITYPNGTRVIIYERLRVVYPVANGTVTLIGKGGLSAGNPLEMLVRMHFFKYTTRTTPNSTIWFAPIGAYEAEVWQLGPISVPLSQPRTDSQGFPKDANFTLKNQDNWWTNDQWVIYNQGGSYNANMTINGIHFIETGPIFISSEDVTVASQTNQLLVSLTFAIIGFSALELRKD